MIFPLRDLVIIPVFDEEQTLPSVLEALFKVYSDTVLLVDDGSTDRGVERAQAVFPGRFEVIRHEKNRGYGASLITGFQYSLENGYERVVTMDCDWQHQPSLVPSFFKSLSKADIVSGSRYMQDVNGSAPKDRKAINHFVSGMIQEETGLYLTDSFCGFKAYRREVLEQFQLSEEGYAIPLQMWAQVAHFGFSVLELSVPLIYLDPSRSFGGKLDDPEFRKAHYISTWNEERVRWAA